MFLPWQMYSFKITTQRVIHKISQDLIKYQSSAMERAAKLQRLHYMRRSLPHISASALAAVLEDVQKFGNVDLHQRKHIRESTEKELSKWNAYGPLFHELTLVGFEHRVQVVAVNVLTLFFCSLQTGRWLGQSYDEPDATITTKSIQQIWLGHI